MTCPVISVSTLSLTLKVSHSSNSFIDSVSTQTYLSFESVCTTKIMPPRTAPAKGVRYPKIAPRPAAGAPASFTNPQPYTVFPPELGQKMNALIVLSRQIESLKRGLEFNLFAGLDEHRKVQSRMQQLCTKYNHLRFQTNSELNALGYFPKSISIPFFPLTTSTLDLKIDVQASRGPQTATHKHEYGPTSPHYTVDKALKRKADKLATPTEALPVKKRKGSVESDYVETESEGEWVSSGKTTKANEKEEDTSSPPEAITCIAMIPLPKKDSQKMKAWTWKGAERKRKVRDVGEGPHELWSPKAKKGSQW